MAPLRSTPFDWSSRALSAWFAIAPLASALALFGILAGLDINDAPMASPTTHWIVAAAAIVAGLVALAMSLKRPKVAYGTLAALGVIASGGLCCLGSVGADSSRDATSLLLGSLGVGIAPIGLAALATVLGRNARDSAQLDTGERTIFLFGAVVAISGLFGLWYGWQLGVSWWSAGVALVGLAGMAVSCRTVARWRTWLARFDAAVLPGWRIGTSLGIDTATTPAWLGEFPEACLFATADGDGGPFREGQTERPVARMPSSTVARQLVRARLQVRGATIIGFVLLAGAALALGGLDRVPHAVASAYGSSRYEVERFDGYAVPGLQLWYAQSIPGAEGPQHQADVVGFDPRTRQLVSGPELFHRAGSLPPAQAARRAADMLLHRATSTIGTVHAPSVQNGLLTFDLENSDSSEPGRVVVSLQSGDVVSGD